MKKALLAVLLLLCVVLCAACGEKAAPADTAPTLTSLKITQAPAKTAYTAGESFDKTGMVVKGVYSDGSETEITAYTVDKTTLAESDTAVTVSYKGLTATQTVTVTAAASGDSGSGDSGSGDSGSGNSGSGDSGSGSGSSASYSALAMINPPVRSLYVAGETFDPAGILLRGTTDEGPEIVTACTFADTALTAGTTSVTVTSGGATVDVPVTVVAGSPMAWGAAPYAQSAVSDLINDLTTNHTTQTNIDIGLVYDGKPLVNMLPDPYPAGVTSFAQLLAEVDYHLFYGCDSIVVKVNYDYGDLEETLDRLYFESGFAGACMSIKGQALDGGYIQVIVKYYSDTLMSVTPTAVIPTYLDFTHTASTRAADYTFSTIDAARGIAVYNSEQAIWALTHGYTIAPVPGSPFETVLNRAKEILIACCDDTMTPYQKMYNVYYYIQAHVTYDVDGEEWAGLSPDPENESDMLSAMLVSFRAEGPLLYGNAACYGYAKGITLLLALEGLDITRVVGKFDDIVGRSQYEYDFDNGEYIQGIGVHSLSYVRIEGYDYLIDGTYAYAGAYYEVHGQYPVLHRDFCVGYSKDRHHVTYSGMLPDPYCSSPDYNPGNFYNELLASYDGVHDCLLESTGEVTAYMDAILDKATTAGTYYEFSATVRADLYPSRSEALSALHSAMIAKCDTAFSGGYDWWRGTLQVNVDGVDCYMLLAIIYVR